jgi:hypothetical protein
VFTRLCRRRRSGLRMHVKEQQQLQSTVTERRASAGDWQAVLVMFLVDHAVIRIQS